MMFAKKRNAPLPWLLLLASCCCARGGGSGLNTVVVVNTNSANSIELGNYFCEKRRVPPDNLLRIGWTGGNISWTSDQFQTILLSPLLGMLANRQLGPQIDYVVLSMDIPYQTTYLSINSTTAALFYGLKPGGGIDWKGVTNSYAFSESAFPVSRPASAPGYSFLATMITADSLAQAKTVIDRGVASDGTFPRQPVMLTKSSDPSRNVRYPAFDNAIYNTRIRGYANLQRVDSDATWSLFDVFGCETGLANFSLAPNAFVPGSIADDLTSYGGLLFGTSGQTTLLAFIEAGAVGSYGTVSEPSPDVAKFPDPQVYFYQSRGFTLAESYYQSLQVPYEGLVVGEPLAAPFAQPGNGQWIGPASNSVVSGRASMAVNFTAADPLHPLQRADLYVDGRLNRTLTNVAPAFGNILNVSLNGYPVSFVVPPDADLRSLSAGVAARINNPLVTNQTRVIAFPRGDRIELRSLSTNRSAEPFFFKDPGAASGISHFYRVKYLSPMPKPQLSALRRDPDGAFRLQVDPFARTPYTVLASSDLVSWTPIFTNLSGSFVEFVDPDARLQPQRFYKVAASVPDFRPRLSSPTPNGPNLSVHVESGSALPYAIEFSADLTNWVSVFTNSPGGALDFLDPAPMAPGRGFYRARVLPEEPTPRLAPTTAPDGSRLLRIDSAPRPYTVEMSSDLLHWTPLLTNSTPDLVRISASSSPGKANPLSTWITAPAPVFSESAAHGLRTFAVNGIMNAGNWLQLNITKTNHEVVTVAVTNLLATATVSAFVRQLVSAVNASPDLGGPDGVTAEDATPNLFGGMTFNLRARSPGDGAAAIQAELDATSRLVVTPSTPGILNDNLSDLQPRAHLYLSAGCASLLLAFSIDTTSLSDGTHELTAVAVEGDHVRTQTQAALVVQVRNSSLAANLALLDLADSAPVQGAYHVAVTANITNIAVIRLYSTGGLLAAVSNQPSATFTVNGPVLGAGRHGFYAEVGTVTGLRFRTATRWARLTR